jgi:nitroreductase
MRRAASHKVAANQLTGARHAGNDRHDAGDAAAKARPVPDALINRILQAGQWAPSGGNTQRRWFLVVKDPEKVRVYY